jgi:hypothetical protein
VSVTVFFVYLGAILCTFQISVGFYYVPVGGRGGLERGGAGERGMESIPDLRCTHAVPYLMYRYLTSTIPLLVQVRSEPLGTTKY